MSFLRGSFIALIGTALILASIPGAANIGPLEVFKGGGVLAPLSPHQSIRLESQQVVIRLEHSTYTVDVVFRLFNSGETTTERIGFPEWSATRVASYPTFIRFEGSVNGRSIEFSREQDHSEDGRGVQGVSSSVWHYGLVQPIREKRRWLVSRVTFPGHAETIIRVTFDAPYVITDYRQALYIYGTGSLWHGIIGKAVFIVDSTEVGGTEKIEAGFETRPGPMSGAKELKSVPRPLLKNVMRYEITDFKPHPEAYLRIRLTERLPPRRIHVRTKPLGSEPLPASPASPPMRKEPVRGSGSDESKELPRSDPSSKRSR